MKNRLVDDETRRQFGPNLDERRCSGRSIGRALRFIGEAMENPGTVIPLYDHYLDYSDNQSSTIAAGWVDGMIKKLKLQFLIVYKNEGRYFLRYDVFEE